MAQKDGVESDWVKQKPCIFEGNRAVDRIKHSPRSGNVGVRLLDSEKAPEKPGALGPIALAAPVSLLLENNIKVLLRIRVRFRRITVNLTCSREVPPFLNLKSDPGDKSCTATGLFPTL